jgi:hypothetical protein
MRFLAVKTKKELHPEEIAQLREFTTDLCKQGVQSVRGVINRLEMNGQRYHVGVIAIAVTKYVNSLYN